MDNLVYGEIHRGGQQMAETYLLQIPSAHGLDSLWLILVSGLRLALWCNETFVFVEDIAISWLRYFREFVV